MWSLPDIARLNSRAADLRVALQNAVETGLSYYNIFSDDPKGVITVCDRHDGYSGSPMEGYFTCAVCDRIMAENYTWELYYVNDENLGQVCLPCAADRYTADESNWIELTPENIEAVDFERIRQAKHVMGVRMPVPKSIVQFGNGVTLDSSSGGLVRGFSYADHTPDAGVRELL